MKTAVEWYELKIKNIEFWVETKQITWKEYHKEKNKLLEQAKEMEKEQKIKMLNTFLCNAQMGEDVEDVEGWFENYEKQQSFFKPVLGEPIWNITNRTTKQQEQ